VTLAIAGDAPEEHLRLTLPRHARKFIHCGDQKVGQQAIDFFIDNDHRQALVRRAEAAEFAFAQRIAAILKAAPAPGFSGFDDDIAPRLDFAAAPGTIAASARIQSHIFPRRRSPHQSAGERIV